MLANIATTRNARVNVRLF